MVLQAQGLHEQSKRGEMLSRRLVALIEDHADELTHGLIEDLHTNPRTPEYHKLPRSVIHRRMYEIYHNLGEWLGHENDAIIEAHYTGLARARITDRIPLSEVICALILTKNHLREYIRTAGLANSAIELYQQQELNRLVGNFFDKAIYFTAREYERAGKPMDASTELAVDAQER
ncbi:MAG: hypothetical protein LAP13_18280 [Acidobacteriia bacterium]|nr:hypothetical protein [Terriglobia bacterium]